MASTPTDPYDDCLGINRTRIPINILCFATAIHYFVILFILWDYSKKNDNKQVNNNTATEMGNNNNDDNNNNNNNNDNENNDDSDAVTDYGGDDQIQKTQTDNDLLDKSKECNCIVTTKFVICILFAIFACTQMILDYIAYSQQMQDANALDWKKYQCSVHIFSNSPNVVHAIAAFFSFCTSFIIKKFDKTARPILFILVLAEVFFIVPTPFLGSLFTHIIPGILTYAWGSLPLIIFALILFKWSNQQSLEFSSRTILIFIGCFLSMWSIVLMVVVVSNTQIKLYDGKGYIKAFTETIGERNTGPYVKSVINGKFDDVFTFVWLIL